MTLTEILSELYRRLRYTSAPPAAITTRLTATINEVHRELCSLPELRRLRDDTITVTAFNGVSRSGLPVSIARVNGIVDRTNNVKLMQVPLSELRIDDPSQAFASSYPIRYAVVGGQAVQVQPTAATGLWAVSTDAADTTQKVFVESIITGGYPNNIISAGTTLTGLARVAIGARTDHIEITRLYLDTAAVGFVSLFNAAAAGTELARIPIGKTFSRYLAVEWWPIPSQDTTEYADITRHIYDLVKGTDEPLIPPDFHETIVDGTLLREYLLLDDTRAVTTRISYERGQRDLVSWVMDDGDRIASLRPVALRWNRLGGQYPAEMWPWY